MCMHTHVTMEYRSCSKYCSFTSLHSCCRSSRPRLFLLTASIVTSCIHSEQTITVHASIVSQLATPSIVSKILMAASKYVSWLAVLSSENKSLYFCEKEKSHDKLFPHPPTHHAQCLNPFLLMIDQ